MTKVLVLYYSFLKLSRKHRVSNSIKRLPAQRQRTCQTMTPLSSELRLALAECLPRWGVFGREPAAYGWTITTNQSCSRSPRMARNG